MADYSADDIFGTSRSRPEPKPKKIEYSSDEIFSAGQDMPASKPRFSGESDGAGFKTLVQAGLVDDPSTKIRIYAKARGVPEDQIPDRFTEKGGQIYFKGDDGVFRPESPSGIGGFGKQLAADLISHGPSVALSTVGGVLGGVAGNVPGALLGAGAGGAAGEGYRKLIGSMFFDEPQTSTGNIKSMSAEGAMAAGGEYLGIAGGRAFNAVKNRRSVRDLNKLNQQAVKNLTELAEKQGIQLTPAELTGLQSLIRQQWLLGNLPDSSDTIMSFLKNREPQIQKAAYNFFNKLSSEKTPFVGYRKGVRAAKQAREKLVDIRREASENFYQEAFKKNPEIDVSDMTDWINSKSANASSDQLRTLNWLKKEFGTDPAKTKSGGGRSYAGQKETGREFVNKQGLRETEKVPSLTSIPEKTINYTPTYKAKNLQKFHNVKLSIDKKLEALENRTLSADKVDRRILTEFKDIMLKKMKSASSEYEQGLEKFKELSAPINKLDDSIVGGFVKYDDEQAMELASKIFGSKSSPEAIREARTIISSADPKSWDSVVRAYMQDTFERVRDNVAGETKNIGGVFRKAIFGSPRQRQMLEASMSKNQFGALKDLMTVFDATGKSFKGQSITVPAGYAARELEQDAYATGSGLIKRGIDVVDIASAPGRVRRFYEGYLQGKYNERLAEILTDKNAMERLRKETMKMRDAGGAAEKLPHLTRSIAIILGPDSEDKKEQ